MLMDIERSAPRVATARKAARLGGGGSNTAALADLPPQVIAVDPAARCLAWSRSERGVLVGVAYATSPSEIEVSDLPALWVFETPQRYAGRGETHSNLDGLDRTLRSVAALAEYRGEQIVWLTPHQWKGNVPKLVHHHRLVARLSAEERALLPALPKQGLEYKHDLWDAAGMNLFATQRVGRGGVAR